MTTSDKIIETLAKQGEKISTIENTCKEIKTYLIGDEGLIVRTDRLEQRAKFKTRLFWVVMIAIIGVLAKVIVP